jgi:hypothetical protein
MKNLIAEPRGQRTLEEMKADLEKLLKATGVGDAIMDR